MQHLLLGVIVSVCAGLVDEPARALTIDATTIDYPQSVSSQNAAVGINNNGFVVGYLSFSDYYHLQGYVWKDGSFIQTLSVPENTFTALWTILNDGRVTGRRSPDPAGGTQNTTFIFSYGSFQDFVLADNKDGNIVSITENGAIYGTYTENNIRHGYSFDYYAPTDSKIVTYQYPGATETALERANDMGQFAGAYFIGGGEYAFMFDGQQFVPIDIPGAVISHAYGINRHGIVVGGYYDGTRSRGFLYRNGRVETVDVRGAAETGIYGINDNNQVVGYYRDSQGLQHGFVANLTRRNQ